MVDNHTLNSRLPQEKNTVIKKKMEDLKNSMDLFSNVRNKKDITLNQGRTELKVQIIGRVIQTTIPAILGLILGAINILISFLIINDAQKLIFLIILLSGVIIYLFLKRYKITLLTDEYYRNHDLFMRKTRFNVLKEGLRLFLSYNKIPQFYFEKHKDFIFDPRIETFEFNFICPHCKKINGIRIKRDDLNKRIKCRKCKKIIILNHLTFLLRKAIFSLRCWNCGTQNEVFIEFDKEFPLNCNCKECKKLLLGNYEHSMVEDDIIHLLNTSDVEFGVIIQLDKLHYEIIFYDIEKGRVRLGTVKLNSIEEIIDYLKKDLIGLSNLRYKFTERIGYVLLSRRDFKKKLSKFEQD